MKKILGRNSKKASKSNVIRLLLVVLLLFIANSSESDGISQTFFTIAYFLTAFEYLYKGFIAILRKDFFNNEFLLFVVSVMTLIIGISHAALIVNLYHYLYSAYEFIAKYRRESSFITFSSNVEHVNILDEFGSVSVVTPDQIKPGDFVRVNPGEYILTDGVVTEGFSTVNTTEVTKDIDPSEISLNDKVYAGYINLSSPIIYKSKTDINSTHFEKECDYAANSVKSGTKNYNFVKKYTHILSAALIILSFIMFFISMFADINSESVVVLAITSVMLSIKGIGNYVRCDATFAGVSNGILYKNSDDLIDLSEITTAVFEFKDKIGDFVIDSIEVYDEFSEDNLKDIASCLYSKSALPFAGVIRNYAGELTTNLNISGYREIDHSGCFAYIDGCQVVSGTTEFMKKSKIHIPITTDDEFDGIHFAVDGNYIGNIHFESNNFYRLAKSVARLRCCGVKHVVIFGMEDEAGVARIRDALNADYFSVADDRTRVINDIIDSVPGRVVLFGWHDWMVNGVKSVYLGNGKLTDDFADANVIVSGKSISHTASVIEFANNAKHATYISLSAIFIFKAIIALFALFGAASVYFAFFGEFVLYIALSLIWTFKFKRHKS